MFYCYVEYLYFQLYQTNTCLPQIYISSCHNIDFTLEIGGDDDDDAPVNGVDWDLFIQDKTVTRLYSLFSSRVITKSWLVAAVTVPGETEEDLFISTLIFHNNN